MLYPFMTLEDETEIVHSEMDGQGCVRVEIEKPVEGGFHAAVCTLPQYEWTDVVGFSKEDISRYQRILEQWPNLIESLRNRQFVTSNNGHRRMNDKRIPRANPML